jgi:hypothetical protein
MHAFHPWHQARQAAGRRFAQGLIASLALTLVAFEWRMDGAPAASRGYELPPEPPVELPPVVIIRETSPGQAQHRQRSAAGPVSAYADAAEPGEPEPTDTGTGAATSVVDTMSAPVPGPDEVPDYGIVPWGLVGQRPYFRECLARGKKDLDECTERRIDQHLHRYFRVPEDMRREEFTVVTFAIGRDGRIGELRCTPRPSASVQQEIERVIRLLPEFEPGTQNGVPVQVVYQLPFRVKRL